MSKGTSSSKQGGGNREPFAWKCSVKGCKITGRAATKEDAQLMALLHFAMKHSGK